MYNNKWENVLSVNIKWVCTGVESINNYTEYSVHFTVKGISERQIFLQKYCHLILPLGMLLPALEHSLSKWHEKHRWETTCLGLSKEP